MKRSISLTTTFLAAFLALLLLTSAVHSEPLTDRGGQDPVPTAFNPRHAHLFNAAQARSSGIQPLAEYNLTRTVTVTVGSSTVPLTPALNSHWQIDTLSQPFLTGTIALPTDASDIIVLPVNGEYGIDYSGPTIYLTNSQGLHYEYRTDQQARRFGNQILIAQAYRWNRPLHYVGTVIFTDPYQHVGTAGYAPTPVNPTELHWDVSFTETKLNEFWADTWLVDTRLPDTRPDLEISAASLHSQLNKVRLTADIHNNGPMTAWVPVYLNLYDRLAPSVPPTSPLDLTNGWCTLSPFSWCGGANNPLPAISPYQTVNFTAEFDLSPIPGQHDIYLLVDALGGSQGLNVESAEPNNVRRVGSVTWWSSFTFLPLIKR